jgi:DNA adenine methylase
MRYHGGKFRLANWIRGFFPSGHTTYIEPFAGAASVLMSKPRVRAEVYNDLDERIVNVFKVLRDPITANELRRRIRLTPFARTEFEDSYRRHPVDAVDAAHITIIQAFMGYGSDAATRNQRPGFRAKRAQASLPSQEWAAWPESVPAFVDRLRGVVIECRNALDVMRDYDTPTTLHYVDPPYLLSTRYAKGAHGYRHEMKDEHHQSLAQVLHGLSGMVVLSGYASPLYDQELYSTWQRHERDCNADSGNPRTEVIWINPACAQALSTEAGQLGLLSSST